MRNDIPRCLKRVRFPMPHAKYQDLMLKLSLKRRKNYARKKKKYLIPLEMVEKIANNESERDVGEIVPGDTMTSTEKNIAQYREVNTEGWVISPWPFQRIQCGRGNKQPKKKHSGRVPLSHYIYFQFKVGVYLIR